MAQQGEEKLHVGNGTVEAKASLAMKRNWKSWLIPALVRVGAFCATLSATIVMALNKETVSFVVATVGNTPIRATLTAKFQHSPANVFFVITNAMASFHSLLMLGVQFCGQKLPYSDGLRLAAISIFDMMAVVLVSAGVSGATFIAELGKNGNSHARWDKVCDKFDTFCDHAAGALLASFIGIILLMITTVISIMTLHKQIRLTNQLVAP